MGAAIGAQKRQRIAKEKANLLLSPQIVVSFWIRISSLFVNSKGEHGIFRAVNWTLHFLHRP